MIALVQRVARASVSVDGKLASSIGKGILVLVGIFADDTDADIEYCARKCAELRIFEDGERKMNRSVEDIGGEILVVSQFTLAARVRKGRRPSFDRAMQPDKASLMIGQFCDILRKRGLTVGEGVFGALMDVELVNSGPVTIIVDSREKR